MTEFQQLVFPGDTLGRGPRFEAGGGAYLHECESEGVSEGASEGVGQREVRAALLGRLVSVPLPEEEEEEHAHEHAHAHREGRSTLHVIAASHVSSQDTVIDIGDSVTGRVVRISTSQAFVTILAVGDSALRAGQQPSALVRKEDIRLADTDSLVLHECFRPGDIIEARVISLGDARQYFLSTAEPECGVRWARSEVSGQLLTPLSWKEMEDPVTHAKEPRKVAKPRSAPSSSQSSK
jgi:exosome complex component CSL4